jgi:hypothetical protein
MTLHTFLIILSIWASCAFLAWALVHGGTR